MGYRTCYTMGNGRQQDVAILPDHQVPLMSSPLLPAQIPIKEMKPKIRMF
jgi:hypothetical protein